MHPVAFEAQITRLLQEGFEAVTFTEAVQDGGGRKLAVTFDDGFASVAEIAKPILDRLGAPATIYAVSDFAAGGHPLQWDGVDRWRGGPYEHELRSLDWVEFGRLAEAGWEVGAHTCSHPRLTRCDDDELDRQLMGSRAACEQALDRPCTSVAYPYGDADERVVAAAARAGFVAGAALPARWHRATPLEWPRVGVWFGDGDRRFAIKTSRAVRSLRSLLEPRLPRPR